MVLQPVQVEQPTAPPYVAALLDQQSMIIRRMRLHTAGLLGLLVMLAAVAYFAGPIQDYSRNRQLGPAERAVVRLVVPDGKGGIVAWGSGTIVDESGLVLTNAHVAAPSAPGLQLLYGPRYPRSDPDYLEVWTLGEGVDHAEAAYRATTVVADGYLDLAVVRIVSDIEGNVLPDETSFPTADLGGLDQSNRGDTVHVIGYPDIAGGAAQRISSGTVAAWLDDERLPGDKDVLDTTASVTGGNSGGALIDEQGDVVAVPMALKNDTGGALVSAGRARPVSFAKPLIERALQSQARDIKSDYVQPPTGRESAELVGWSDWQSDGKCGLPTDAPPPGALRVCAHVRVAGMSPGLDLLLEVVGPEDYATARIGKTGPLDVLFGLKLARPLDAEPDLMLHLAGGQDHLELE